jgi:chromosome segregation ATPase
MEFEGLLRLEDIVGRLLTKYGELKKQNEMLTAEIDEKKQELVSLQQEVSEMRGDKEEIHHRVSSILTKLEEWELVKHEGSPAVDEATPETPAAQESQKHLFNMGV